jgi:lipoprotein NlpD
MPGKRAIRITALVLVVFLVPLGAPKSVAAPAAPSQVAGAPAAQVHSVRQGETLYGIAGRYGVSVGSLLAANGMQPGTVRVKPGQRLTIPAPSVTAAAQKSASTAAAPAAQKSASAAAAPGTHKSASASTPPKSLAAAQATQNVSPAAQRTTGSASPRSTQAVRVRPAAYTSKLPGDFFLAVPNFQELPPPFQWPVDGPVSSTFGRRRSGWHRGIDIKADKGTPVIAAAMGLVIASFVERRYGNVVKVAHDNGFVTVYAHNHRNLVDVGDWVAAGQRIALVGRTGRATGEHLHFEIRHEGLVYNPIYLLPMPTQIAKTEDTDLGEHDEE